MMDPCEILGVSPTADEAAIRANYLKLVREYPPERAPERFAQIHEAYDLLRDPIANLERRLFGESTPFTFETIVAEHKPDVRKTRLATSMLLSLASS